MRPTPLAAALAVLLVLSARAGAQDFGAVEIRTVPVSGPVHMLVGRGGNLAVSTGEQGVFLVDDQFGPLTAKIEAAIGALGGGPVRFVLNTHWHGDHTGGNENLGKAGAVIVAHGNVRERMSVDQVQELRSRTVPASPPGALPIVTFTRDVSFHLNGERIDVFHVPDAHTDGDAVVHFRGSDAIHAGDVFFNGVYPYIDLDSGGSVDGVHAALEQILELAGPATRIIPGHGPLGDSGDVRAARDMLATVRDRVRVALTTGTELEAFTASQPLADLDPTWGGGFIQAEDLLHIVWTDLARRGTP